MEDGWIKLHRKMREWQHYQRPSVRLVFEELLFCANTKPGFFHGMSVKRGETMASISTIEEYTGFSRKTVIKALAMLEESGEIRREKCGNYTKTIICKFDHYQGVDKKQSGGKIPPHTPPPSTPADTPPSTPEQELNKDKKEENNILVETRARESDWFDAFLNSTIQIQAFCMQNGVSEGDFKVRAHEVWADWELTGVTHSDETDFRRHLLSTIRIKLQNNGSTNTNRVGYVDQRKAERERLARGYAAVIARLAAEDDARAAEVRQSQ